MNTKIWLITKQEAEGHQRKLGFIERRNDDIYYAFTMDLINYNHLNIKE